MPKSFWNRAKSGWLVFYEGVQTKETKMHNLKIKAGDWVVVCDGRKALVLQNAGDEVFPNLQTRETHEPTNKTGNAAEPASEEGSDVAQAERHDIQSEQDFITGVAKRLDAAVSGGETEALFVVAAPRALGVLREAYTPAVRKAVREEIAKDYVNMPVYEIEKLLTPAAV